MRAKKPQTRQTGSGSATPHNASGGGSATSVKKPTTTTERKQKAKKSTNKTTSPTAAKKSTKKDTNEKDDNKKQKSTSPVKTKISVTSTKKSPPIKTKPTVTANVKKDEKIPIKQNKELKNLDIQINVFGESDSSNAAIPSISEIVKTKSRTMASATPATSPTPVKLLPHNDTAESSNAHEQQTQQPKGKKSLADKKKSANEKNNANKDKATMKKPATASIKKKNEKKTNEKKKLNVSVSTEEKLKKKKPKQTKKMNKEVNVTTLASTSVVPTSTTAATTTTISPATSISSLLAKQTKVGIEIKETPLSLSKSIEIKAQIDESKSLIDTITDAINEVVKQYKDSALNEQNSEENEHNSSCDKNTVAKKSDDKDKIGKKSIKNTKKKNVNGGKVVKPTKKKILGKDVAKKLKTIPKLEKNVKKDVKNILKNSSTTLKKTPKKQAKIKIDVPKEIVSSLSAEKEEFDAKNDEKEFGKSEKSTNTNVNENIKEIENDEKLNSNVNIDSIVNKTKTQIAILKKTKKLIPIECNDDEIKGSKMIKIDAKSKKIQNKPKTNKMKKEILNEIIDATATATTKKGKITVRNIETMQENVIKDTATKVEKHKNDSDSNEDDVDNISLKKLKATLLQTQQNAEMTNKTPATKKQPSVKSSSVSSLTKKKPKPKLIKTNEEKVIINTSTTSSATATTMSQPTTDTTDEKMPKALDGKLRKDIYDFHESGHSSEDTLSTYKKKKDTSSYDSSFDTIPDTPTKKMIAARASEAQKRIADAKAATASTAVTTASAASTSSTAKNNSNSKKKIDKIDATKKKLPPKKSIKAKALANESDNELLKNKNSAIDGNDLSYSDDNNDNNKKKKKFSKRKSTSESSLSHSSSDENDDNADDDGKNSVDSDTSARTRINNRRKLAAKSRRMKLFGFYSGPKKHRMASLNALAKVQCLYENESRTAQELGFVKEPRIIPKELRIVGDPSTSSSQIGNAEMANIEKEKEKERKTKIANEVANQTKDKQNDGGSNRTLRNGPGLRGAGILWEMDDSSMDESDIDESVKQVSYY